MASIQQATASFFAPVTVAYLTACCGWLASARFVPNLRPATMERASTRPRVDLLVALGAAGAILLLGQAYRAGYLLRAAGSLPSALVWTLNNLIIFSPIAAVLLVRRQGLSTIYISRRGLVAKLVAGLGLGILAVMVFQLLRGEVTTIPRVFGSALERERLVNFLPVFLEGVAMAFLFVRLRWALGLAAALAVPAILFAAAHVPEQIREGLSPWSIASFFVLNTLLPAIILFVIQRSRDVIWIGLVHYLMDVAIRAF